MEEKRFKIEKIEKCNEEISRLNKNNKDDIFLVSFLIINILILFKCLISYIKTLYDYDNFYMIIQDYKIIICIIGIINLSFITDMFLDDISKNKKILQNLKEELEKLNMNDIIDKENVKGYRN